VCTRRGNSVRVSGLGVYLTAREMTRSLGLSEWVKSLVRVNATVVRRTTCGGIDSYQVLEENGIVTYVTHAVTLDISTSNSECRFAPFARFRSCFQLVQHPNARSECDSSPCLPSRGFSSRSGHLLVSTAHHRATSVLLQLRADKTFRRFVGYAKGYSIAAERNDRPPP